MSLHYQKLQNIISLITDSASARVMVWLAACGYDKTILSPEIDVLPKHYKEVMKNNREIKCLHLKTTCKILKKISLSMSVQAFVSSADPSGRQIR